jgi:rhodanese-related sulfurtransferase
MGADLIQAAELQRQLSAPASQRGPLLVDIRRQRQHQRSRIPGSHNIPAAQLLSGELPDADLILISNSEAESASVAEALHSQGYHRRIQHLAGGYRHWRSAGLPLEGFQHNQPRVERIPWIAVLANRGNRKTLRPCS